MKLFERKGAKLRELLERERLESCEVRAERLEIEEKLLEKIEKREADEKPEKEKSRKKIKFSLPKPKLKLKKPEKPRLPKLRKKPKPIVFMKARVEEPKYDRLIEVPSGKLAFGERKIYVWCHKPNGTWGVLAPLVEYEGTQEIFLRGDKIEATLENRGYEVVLGDFNPEKLVSKLAILACPRGLSEEEPQAEGELENWRLYFKLSSISGKVEMTATKIIKIPPLTEIIDPLLAARLITLTLRPSVIAIIGPAGSGKTTFLNSLLNLIIELYKIHSFRITVIEQVRELVLPETARIGRSHAGPKTDVTTLLRQSMRYERPDILVLGELRGEEIWSWVEAGRLGIATLTTYHSPSVEKAVFSMAGLMRRNMPQATIRDVLNLVDVFILTKKYKLITGTARRVEAVYVSDGEKLIPLYIEGFHSFEEVFWSFIPPRIMTGDARSNYENLKSALGVKEEELRFAELEPLKI